MEQDITIVCGMDIGDRYSHICLLDGAGEVIEESRVKTTIKGIEGYFRGKAPMVVSCEVGTHSPWISRLVASHGHEVLVANARKLRMIYENEQKDDRVDAEMLARVARFDRKLLSPITHRGEETRADLSLIRSRDTLVQTRTKLVNHVRGTVKASGCRLQSCSTESFWKLKGELPKSLRPALNPVMATIRVLTKQISGYDKRIKKLADKSLEAAALCQVPGVGELTALAFILTLEEPGRFMNGRTVGSYLGLCPGTKQSGKSNPQMRITKAGDSYLRCLLVGSAHYILGPFGPDTDLRRWGLRLAERGGKSAKKRAAVAVARKLSALMYRLWITGETYEPLRCSGAASATQDPRREGAPLSHLSQVGDSHACN